MSKKSSAKQQNIPDELAFARDSLHKIRRVSEESLFDLYEIDPEKAFRLSYLREQFVFKGLDTLFNRYTQRINQAYFSLYLLLQSFLSITHFIVVLVINAETNTLTTIIPDLIFYSVIGLFSLVALYLNEKYVKSHAHILKILSLTIFTFVLITDLFIPIYYSATSLAPHLRPAYSTLILIACYVFCNINSDLFAILLGICLTACYLLTLGFVTYDGYKHLWKRLGSDCIYLICINGLGIYFRFANELVKRRAFLDRRACVESTLKLKFEKEQEEQLMLSIIPQHTINEVRKDIINKIELVEMLQLPTSDPMAIPYVHEYDNVTILYADIVNYTAMTSQLPVVTLVETLNELFGGFDDASEELNVLRIKFLGDCYYCVAGLPPNPAPNHAEACVDLGLRMISIIRSIRERRKLLIDMRIGIHSGRILSGLIGSSKWQFDIWSKDVYLANKMETAGEAGKIHITKQTYDLLQKQIYNIAPTNRGSTDDHLKPYDVTTFFITPEVLQQENQAEATTNSEVLPRKSIKKRLSRIGEVDLDEDAQNSLNPSVVANNNSYHSLNEKSSEVNGRASITSNGLLKSASAPDICDSAPKLNGDAFQNGQHYERRESLRNIYAPVGQRMERRPSGYPGVIKRLSGRRITPGDVKRRTAFMDNNINRYNERLEQTKGNLKEAIEKMPLTKYEQWIKVKEINPFTLTFRNCKLEKQYVRLPDPLFKYYLVSYVVLFIAVFIIQNLTLPQWQWEAWTHYAVLAFMIFVAIPITWMHSLWNRYFASNRTEDESKPSNCFLRKLYRLSAFITPSAALRTAIYIFIYALFITCILKELIECNTSTKSREGPTFRSLISVLIRDTREDFLRKQCVIPWHMSHTLSLTILMGFSFLRIHIWLKLIFASAVTAFYSVSVWDLNYKYYQNSETFNYGMKPQIAHTIALVFLTIALLLIDRQSDYLSRLDYQWNQQLVKEQTEVNTMHKITKMLLKNILPIHVAELYLDVNRKSNVLYNEEYDNVAVIFASVVDSPIDSVSEKFFLGIMNRIIKDFDNLLPKERRKPIEKIKVTNMTYMAACGLDPGRRDSIVNGYSERHGEHVAVTLVNFAVDMIAALTKLNKEMGQQCKLRIGIAHGEVMAGVVGSKKPLYDIWGDTVNVASRMDSTGVPGKIQVTKETATVLEESGIMCEFRDFIFVKGKGENIPTYFVSLTDDDELIYNTSL